MRRKHYSSFCWLSKYGTHRIHSHPTQYPLLTVTLLACTLFFQPAASAEASPQCNAPTTDATTTDIQTDTLAPDDSTRISADSTFSSQAGESIFAGNVEIRQNGRLIKTDKATFSRQSGSIRLQGGIQIESEAMRFSADSGDMNTNHNRGQIDNAGFLIKSNNLRGRADSIQLDNHDNSGTTLHQTYVTSCPPEQQDWLLSADSIELDHIEQYGKADDVVIEFLGVPFFYLPYMEFPIGDRRRSGILSPQWSNTSSRGFEFALPWYWNIAPNHDAILTPRYMNKRGLQLDTRYRFLTSSTSGELNSTYLSNDDITRDKRYFTGYRQNTAISDSLNLKIDIKDVSDIDYFRDFSNSLALSSQTHLGRRAVLSHTYQQWQTQLLVQSYETIDASVAVANRPYQMKPQLRIDGRQAIAGSGLNFTLQAEWTDFDHQDPTNPTGSRTLFAPGLEWPIQGNSWFLKPSVQLSHTRYDVRDGAGVQLDLADRNMLISSLDTGLIFERQLTNGATQTLEPRLFYLRAPFRDQSAYPLFDTSAPTFNFAQLFRSNRFNGIDRISDANQLTAALTTRVLTASGNEIFQASIGQIHYFEDRLVSLTAPETISSSDLVAEMTTRLDDWQARVNLQWDSRTRQQQRQNYLLQYRSDNRHVFNLAYRALADANPANEISQSDVSFVTPVSDNTAVFGRWNYSHTEDQDIDVIAGIAYESCCWSLQVSAQRQRLTGTVNEYDNRILLQLVLKGLGSVSGNTLSNTLKRAIPGYQ